MLDDATIARVCGETLDSWDVDGRDVLLLIPDGTRTCPVDVLFRHIYAKLESRVTRIDVLIALGTHQPMSDEAIYERVGLAGREEHERSFPKAKFHNHAWRDPGTLVEIGRFAPADVEAISEGRLSLDVSIEINKMAVDTDRILILGPVFPHEVAGYSGGNKYLFPGISGKRIIDFFHWLGALITNRKIIGTKYTPVREVLDRASAMLDAERRALCMVVAPKDGSLVGLFGGTPEDAWSDAADLSADTHVAWFDRPFQTVLSRCPTMYPDLWTGGKCMYKLERVLADGGELIIWAPHITEVSAVHGHVLERIGYHVRDYFVEQWDRFRDEPWGVLAHSTHVKGDGRFVDGVETPRVNVTLATGLSREQCEAINMGYRDPASIRVEDFEGRQDEGVLYVPKAGEVLHAIRE